MDPAVPEEVAHRRRRRRRRRGQEAGVASRRSARKGVTRLASAGLQLGGLAVYALFFLFIVVAPLPMGANRDWAWAPMTVAVGVLALLCAAGVGGREALAVSHRERTPLLALAACFLFMVMVAVLQMSPLSPLPTATAWYYERAAGLLDQANGAVPGLAVDLSREALLRCIACAAIFLMARVLFRDQQWARLLLNVFVVSAVVVVSYAIFEQVKTHSCYVGDFLKKQGLFQFANDRCLVSGTFVGSNSFGCFVGMGLVAALALILDGQGPRLFLPEEEYSEESVGLADWLSGPKVVHIALALYLLGGALLSASRAGAVATLLGVVILGFLLLRDRAGAVFSTGRIMAIAVFVGIVIFVIAGGAFIGKMSRLSEVANLNRVLIWRHSLVALGESPWLGWGLGSFNDVYAIHQPISIPQPNDKAHSTPLEFAVELGVPGALAAIACCLLPWGVSLVAAVRRQRQRYLSAAAFAVSAVAILHSCVDFSLQIPAIAFVVSALLGMGWAQAFRRSGPQVPAADLQGSFASGA